METEGAICAQFVRCGKPGCKCARGELHGPYYYRFTRDESGRLRKSYVRKAEAASALSEQSERRELEELVRKLRGRRSRGKGLFETMLSKMEKWW